jgi:hypothetical protein
MAVMDRRRSALARSLFRFRLPSITLTASAVLLAVALVAAGCAPSGQSTPNGTPVPTGPTAPPATPTATPPLPPLSAESGYHTVLQASTATTGIGNLAPGASVTVTVGTFMDTGHAFNILAVCEGPGALGVKLSSGIGSTFKCGATPQLQGVNVDASLTHPGTTVRVDVTVTGGIVWALLIEVKD